MHSEELCVYTTMRSCCREKASKHCFLINFFVFVAVLFTKKQLKSLIKSEQASVQSEHDKLFVIALLNHMNLIILLRLCEKKWNNIGMNVSLM